MMSIAKAQNYDGKRMIKTEEVEHEKCIHKWLHKDRKRKSVSKSVLVYECKWNKRCEGNRCSGNVAAWQKWKWMCHKYGYGRFGMSILDYYNKDRSYDTVNMKIVAYEWMKCRWYSYQERSRVVGVM